MKTVFLFLFLLLGVGGLQAAVPTITNWSSQLPNSPPNNEDILVMQQGGLNYYITPAQLAAFMQTNAASGITNKVSKTGGNATNLSMWGTASIGISAAAATAAQVTVSNTSATLPTLSLHQSTNPIPALFVGPTNNFVGIGTANYDGGKLSITSPGNEYAMRVNTNWFVLTNNAAGNGVAGFGTATPLVPVHIKSLVADMARLRFEETIDTTSTHFSGAAFYEAGTFKGGIFKQGNTDNVVIFDATSIRFVVEQGGRVIITNNGSGLKIGPGGGTLTNTLFASATLDFPSTTLGTIADMPITVAGAADGDIVTVGKPSASMTTIAGDFTGFSSNGVVYVRFTSAGTTQDPASGTFKVRVDKFQ